MKKENEKNKKSEAGSIELIVVGLLAALLIVLALPVLFDYAEMSEAKDSVIANDN